MYVLYSDEVNLQNINVKKEFFLLSVIESVIPRKTLRSKEFVSHLYTSISSLFISAFYYVICFERELD